MTLISEVDEVLRWIAGHAPGASPSPSRKEIPSPSPPSLGSSSGPPFTRIQIASRPPFQDICVLALLVSSLGMVPLCIRSNRVQSGRNILRCWERNIIKYTLISVLVGILVYCGVKQKKE
eukprot:gene35317-45731_t